jgi:hypothetical protein
MSEPQFVHDIHNIGFAGGRHLYEKRIKPELLLLSAILDNDFWYDGELITKNSLLLETRCPALRAEAKKAHKLYMDTIGNIHNNKESEDKKK